MYAAFYLHFDDGFCNIKSCIHLQYKFLELDHQFALGSRTYSGQEALLMCISTAGSHILIKSHLGKCGMIDSILLL